MPRGLPDYYNPDTLVSQRLANVEEIVTQQRKIASIDNRGRTLFFDSFGEGMGGWLLSNDGLGEDAVASTAKSLIPPASAYLDAGTSGSSGGSSIIKGFHLGASALIGLETSFRYANNTPNLELFMYYNLAGNEFFARMDILPLSGVVRIWIDSEFVTVGNIGYNGSSAGPWLLIKLVADFVNGKYVRALIGHLELDLTAYALDSSAAAAAGRATFWLKCTAVNAVTNDGYIGHVAGTVDEP